MTMRPLADRYRIKGFDGIRGLSAVAVVAHHTALTFTHIGEVAVYLFFALSGFLIMGILQRSRQAVERKTTTFREALIAFWTGRILRIFPVYYVALAVMLIIGGQVASQSELNQEAPWYLAYLQNYQIGFLARDWGSFAHTWTLAVEQQFYVLFGVIFLCVGQSYHRLVIAVAMLLSLGSYFLSLAWGLPSIVVYTLPGLGFCFILAGCLARTVSMHGQPFLPVASRRWGRLFVLFLGAAIAGISFLPATPNFWSPYLPVPAFIVKTGLILACAAFLWGVACHQDIWLVKWLEWRPLQALGQLSYALYIVHFPVSALGSWVIEHHFGLTEHVATVNFFLTLTLSLILAAISLHFIEKPVARLKRQWRTAQQPLPNAASRMRLGVRDG